MGLAGLALSSVPSEEKQALEANSVLRLQLNKKIYDGVPAVEQFNVGLGFESESLGLDQILHSIQTAAEDANMRLAWNLLFIQVGWCQTRSIRRALQAFKEKGKFVYAYGDFFTQKSYYLASVADIIFLNSVGPKIDFKGLSSELLYYKDFQDKYGVKM